jgi:branched-chain amino acid transport system substrate-binding protein
MDPRHLQTARRHRLIPITILAALMVTLAACSSSAASSSGSGSASNSPITVYYFASTTGSTAAAYASVFTPPGQMAEKAINAAGGINGHPIKIQQIDSQGLPAQAATNYQTYESKASAFIVGLSAELSAVGPLAKRDKIPVLSDASSNQTVQAGRPYTWSLSVDNTLLADLAMKAWTTKLGNLKKISVFQVSDNAATPAQTGEASKWLSDNGFSVNNVSYATADIDYPTLVTKALSSDPDGIVVGPDPASATAIVKELRKQGYTKPIILSSGVVAGSYLSLMGSAGEGVYTFQPFFVDSTNPGETAVANEYKAISGVNLTSGVAELYNAFMLLADAMRTAHVENLSVTAARAALQKAIPDTGGKSIDGSPFTFTPQGYTEGNGYLTQVRDGVPVLVSTFAVK